MPAAKGTVIVLPSNTTPADEQQQPQQQQHPDSQQQQQQPSVQQQQQPLAMATPQPLPSVTRKDVDFLVQEIKENLKLGHHYAGGGPFRAAHRGGGHRHGHHRATPYHVPPSSRVGCDDSLVSIAPGGGGQGPSQLKRWNQRRRYPSTCMNGGGPHGSKVDPDDPFQMLQELITDGSLIKEAVRRLQLGMTPKFGVSAASGGGGFSAAGGGFSASGGGGGGSFYDSDDECRTPPAYPELCCEVAGM